MRREDALFWDRPRVVYHRIYFGIRKLYLDHGWLIETPSRSVTMLIFSPSVKLLTTGIMLTSGKMLTLGEMLSVGILLPLGILLTLGILLLWGMLLPLGMLLTLG